MVVSVMKFMFYLIALLLNLERFKIKKECSDGNIDFNLQKLMTQPSLQMPVEHLLLSFLVSR